MNNDPCVKCKKPLNGGVYRKPNLCPHCFSIQDETLTAKGKPIRGKKAQAQNTPVVPAVAAVEAPIAIEENIEAAVDQLFESEVAETSAENTSYVDDSHVEMYEEVAESTIFDEEKTIAETEEDYLAEESTRIEPTIDAEADEKTHIMPPRKAVVEAQVELEAAAPELKEEVVETKIVETELAETTAKTTVETTAKDKPSADDIDLDKIQSPTIFDEQETQYEYSDDEELYDDFSGIEDDMLIDDENGLVTEEESSETLVARAPADQESFKQEIKESLDIKLKLVPSATEENDVAVAETATRKATAQANSGYESVVLTSETARDIEVEKYLDIVTAECVFETNMVRSDFPRQGRRGSRSMSVVQDARKTVLDTLKQDAFRLGANTVIGLNIEYSEFTRGNQPMMMVVATGTAIRTSKEAVA